MGTQAVWFLFYSVICLALLRPWQGIVGFYFFVFLQPKWNWHYAIPLDFPFERYILIAIIVGAFLQGIRKTENHFASTIAQVGACIWLFVSWLGATQVDEFDSWLAFDRSWKIMLAAYIVSVSLASPERIQTILRAAIIGGFYSAYRITDEYRAIGFCRYVQDGWGYGVGSNQASMTFVGLAIVSLCLSVFETKLLWKAFALVSFAFQSHAIMLFESRGCMLGFVIGIIPLIYFAPKTRANIAAFFGSIIVISILAGPSVIQEFKSSFASAEEADSSALSRYDTWSAGWQLFQENPIFGLGPDRSSRFLPRYLPIEWGMEVGRSTKNPHNTPIEVLCDYGAVGFIGYYVFFFSIVFAGIGLLRNFKRLRVEESIGLTSSVSGIVGIMIASIFSSCLLVETIYFLAGVGAASITSQYLNRSVDEAEDSGLTDTEEEIEGQNDRTCYESDSFVMNGS